MAADEGSDSAPASNTSASLTDLYLFIILTSSAKNTPSRHACQAPPVKAGCKALYCADEIHSHFHTVISCAGTGGQHQAAELDYLHQRQIQPAGAPQGIRRKEFVARKNSEKAKSWFSEWVMAENFGNMKSKIYFTWKPKTPRGPAIDIETTDKAHNLVQIRSQTKNSLIVVSSASNPMSTESWTFVFNFEVETMIATRVQSNIGGVKGEVITYDCHFESLELDG
jgi:hypothetical protein